MGHVVERDPDSRLSRRPEPTTSSGPTLHKTTPKARKESKVRGLQGSQGEPPATCCDRPQAGSRTPHGHMAPQGAPI